MRREIVRTEPHAKSPTTVPRPGHKHHQRKPLHSGAYAELEGWKHERDAHYAAAKETEPSQHDQVLAALQPGRVGLQPAAFGSAASHVKRYRRALSGSR